MDSLDYVDGLIEIDIEKLYRDYSYRRMYPDLYIYIYIYIYIYTYIYIHTYHGFP
jgi:hypothetical protein